METSEMSQQISLATSIASQAGSPARISVGPEREPAWMAHEADSGKNFTVSFASYDHESRWWKTSQVCLTGDLGEFSETWPKAGTMRNGRCYQQQHLERHMYERGSLLWPTPTANGEKLSAKPTPGMGVHFRKHRANILEAIADLIWPSSGEMRSNFLTGCLVNPELPCWLMGFPWQWTDLDLPGTQSSRKSLSGSDAE